MIELMKTTRKDGATLHIIKRDVTYTPYVVCWNFNGQEWDWGTYCNTLDEAQTVFQHKRVEYDF